MRTFLYFRFVLLFTVIKCSILTLDTIRFNHPEIAGRYMISYAPNENHVVIISTANIGLGYGDQFHFLYIDYSLARYSYLTTSLNFSAVSAKSHHQNNNDLNFTNRRFLILDSTKKIIKVYGASSLIT